MSLELVQLGGNMTAQQAGLLTLGYAVAIIAFIRVGEKLLQRFGARKPMIWGCLITGLAILLPFAGEPASEGLPHPCNYRLHAVRGWTGILCDAFDRRRPVQSAGIPGRSRIRHIQNGLVARRRVRGRHLGAIFTALSTNTDSARWMEGVITFYGRQDNLEIRAAAMIALMFNVLMVAVAILSIMLTIPQPKRAQGRLSSEAH